MRLVIAICLLAASGVLAQTGTVTNTQGIQGLNAQIVDCNLQPEHCGRAVAGGPTAQKTIPSPVWVSDPSAGHYDCPDGWTAYTRSEPEVYSPRRVVPANLSYYPPTLDKKGHVLQNQPSASICIQEKP